MNLKTKTFMKRFILIFLLMFAFVQIKNLFTYTMTSIPRDHIAMIEVLTDENLKEMEKTGKITLKNKTITTKNPKRFIENVKKEYFIIKIDSKKYYINVFVHYYIGVLKDNLIYLIMLLSLVLIIGKNRIKNFIKSAFCNNPTVPYTNE